MNPPTRYDNLITCSECGDPLNIFGRIFRDYGGNNFCSSRCKWVHIYREDCSQHGTRPTVPGSWAWASFECFKRDDFRCQRCGSKHELEPHHRIPIAKGGNSLPENLITFCHKCHMMPGMHRGVRSGPLYRANKVDPSVQAVINL